jgi:Fe-S cluster assembly ATP-binding protein
MLEVSNLHASVSDTEILKGLSVTVNPGEVHAVMGPNGGGKSTFANILAGRPEYTVDSGTVSYLGEDLIVKTPDVRAKEGIFLAFQYPVELPGVRFWQFMKAAVDAKRKHAGEKELAVREFDDLWKEKAEQVKIAPELISRSVNEGFSGGEKKRAEMLQLAMLEPKLAILDETDSGLDVDALRTVAISVNELRTPERSFIVVTHYQRLLNYLTPDFVHILVDGQIVESGGADLALTVEESGYDRFIKATAS